MKHLIKVYPVILLALMISCIQNQDDKVDINFLDSNKDGVINPYEALDVLLVMQGELKDELAAKKMREMIELKKVNEEKELEKMFNEFDENNDGVIKSNEVIESMIEIVEMMDVDSNKTVTKTEFEEFNFENSIFLTEEKIQQEITETFMELGDSEKIDLAKINRENHERIFEWDFDKDAVVTYEEAYSYVRAINSHVEFAVIADTAFMNGSITSKAPATVLQLLFEYPNVNTIIMEHVPGSIDDVANLRAALYVNQFGLTTKLKKGSVIASGGTDFFVAGKNRIVDRGAMIGVHSWAEGNVKAIDVPKDDPIHKRYLDFYKKVGIDEEFYWYTLEIAEANEMHFMKEEEIEKYKIRNKR